MMNYLDNFRLLLDDILQFLVTAIQSKKPHNKVMINQCEQTKGCSPGLTNMLMVDPSTVTSIFISEFLPSVMCVRSFCCL